MVVVVNHASRQHVNVHLGGENARIPVSQEDTQNAYYAMLL